MEALSPADILNADYVDLNGEEYDELIPRFNQSLSASSTPEEPTGQRLCWKQS